MRMLLPSRTVCPRRVGHPRSLNFSRRPLPSQHFYCRSLLFSTHTARKTPTLSSKPKEDSRFKPYHDRLRSLRSDEDSFPRAWSVYQEMKQQKLPPQRSSFHLLLSFSAKQNVPAEDTLTVFEEMKHCGIEPDAYSYVIVLRAMAISRRWDDVSEILQRLKQMPRGQCTAFLYAQVITAISSQGNLDLARKAIAQMEESRIEPTFDVYLAQMKMFRDHKLLSEGLDLMRKLKKANIKTNGFLRETLFAMFREAGQFPQVVHFANTELSLDDDATTTKRPSASVRSSAM